MRIKDKKRPKIEIEPINENIKFPVVLLFDEENNQLGEVKIEKARELAIEADLDLVCVAPMAKVPVCKILDYGKYKFEKNKKKKELKKNQNILITKEIRIRPMTDTNDLEVKAKNANKFLQKGDKVKVSVRFRGRELVHKDKGKETLEKFIELTKENSEVETNFKNEGRNIFIILKPKK